jgi:hypothetical protein
MTGKRNIPNSTMVRFFAVEIGESGDESAAHANDNCCPHCGGLLLPGDKASDCSSYRAQPLLSRPWERGVC